MGGIFGLSVRRHLVAGIVGVGLLGAFATLQPSPAVAAEPLTGRCMSIAPICMPGQHPICICESDVSLNCKWVCGSQRR